MNRYSLITVVYQVTLKTMTTLDWVTLLPRQTVNMTQLVVDTSLKYYVVLPSFTWLLSTSSATVDL